MTPSQDARSDRLKKKTFAHHSLVLAPVSAPVSAPRYAHRLPSRFFLARLAPPHASLLAATLNTILTQICPSL